MLVSGGKILAIDQVYTDNRTISGDGVQKPLVVNTDVIATVERVSSVSSKLEQNIDYVSGHLPTVTAGKNVGVEVSATSDGRPLYIVSAADVEQREIHIVGNNGVSAVFNNTTSAWNIGVSANYLSDDALNNYYNKTQVDNKLTDTSSWANNTFQKKGNYVSASDFNQFKTNVNAALDKKQDVSAMSAYAQSAWVNDNYQKKGNYVSADDFNEYKTQVSQEFANTSSWANGKFQEKGDYVSATEFNEYKEQVDNEFESTSAWANETFQEKGDYVSATEFDDYKTEVSQEFTNTSSWANDTFQEKGEYVSASDFNKYKEQVKDEFESTSAWANETFQEKGEYVSASDFEDYKEKVEQDFENTSAWANETFQPIGEYISASEKFLSANAFDDLSGKWESVYNTTVTASGNWNEASAFSAASGKFVTSALEDFTAGLANVLVKDDENNVTWSGVDLSTLGKMYPITSVGSGLVSAYISAVNGVSSYVVSAATPGEVEVPGISGENGVSAQYNTEANKYVVGLSGSPAYASFTATTTADDGVYTPATYSESYNVGNGVTLEDDDTILVGPGLWHVTIYAKVTNTETSPNYYDTVLTCNSIKNIVQFDNSYIHTEYINLDADVVSNDSLAINVKLEDVPANSTVVIEQLQLHRIVTGNVTHEGGNTYTPGDGISIDNYQVSFNAGKGLAVDSITNDVDVQAGSGVFIDANNKLSIKLGKGLAFSADGDIVAIETDTQVNDVVETVETLKKELDGKLTTNMNISDAKSTNNVAPPIPDNGENPSWGASFFTVPLQHNLNELSTISIITSDGINDAAVYPMLIGLLEYNFDFLDPNVPDSTAAGYPADYSRYDDSKQGSYWRSRTTWIADTGLITSDRIDFEGAIPLTAAGKHSYRLKKQVQPEAISVMHDGVEYVNEVGPTLRSDRGYYLVIFGRKASGITRIMSDDGYTENTNSDPIITYGSKNVDWWPTPAGPAQAMTNWSSSTWATHITNDDISLSGISYWKRDVPEAKTLGRPYVMIRNSIR